MALKEMVAERYSGFTSIEETLQSITEQYQCSLGEASLILEEALSRKAGKDEPGLYHPGELRPVRVTAVQWTDLCSALRKKRQDDRAIKAYRQHLCHQDEMASLLQEAGFPIYLPSPMEGAGSDEDIQPSELDPPARDIKARLEEKVRELEEAQAEIDRLKARTPLSDDIWLTMAIDVQHEFWAYAHDPMERDGRQPQTEIVRWIMKKYGVSETRAKEVERMACTVRHRK